MVALHEKSGITIVSNIRPLGIMNIQWQSDHQWRQLSVDRRMLKHTAEEQVSECSTSALTASTCCSSFNITHHWLRCCLYWTRDQSELWIISPQRGLKMMLWRHSGSAELADHWGRSALHQTWRKWGNHTSMYTANRILWHVMCWRRFAKNYTNKIQFFLMCVYI